MTALVYTDAAERDLTQISLYIATDDPRAAIQFVERIRQRCEFLKRFPRIGRQRSDIRSEIRSIPHGSYVIYFEWSDRNDEVRILRIWHGRRRTPSTADLL